MAEAIQQLILEILDKNGSIEDTRELVLPGQSTPAATQDAQLAIIAALNSLLSRNVSRQLCCCNVSSHIYR
jgi:phenylalanyl-tRNA synthetase alpha chain